ncbi:MAG: 2-C-methyl-D-erythritol 4-phosphate cytidylyltransferase [Akkermansiaceae bacterium]
MDVPHSPLTCSAIIVAAGSSRRMGFDKLAAGIRGVPVLRRTLEAFLAAASIESVVVVCPEERWKLLEGVKSDKPIIRVDGGANRQDSVAAGLARISSSHVAVHDGARPLIAPEDINRCVAAAAVHLAATLARRVTETLKRGDDEGFSQEAVSRESLWFMETPQVFAVDILRRAYSAVTAGNLAVTDEVSALEVIGVRVKLVESFHPNLKITTPADLVLAEAIVI